MNTQKDRLFAFINLHGYSVREFERALGVSNGTIRHLNDNLSANIKEKISAKFPQVNMDWLLFGTGDMLKVDQSATQNNAPVYQNNGKGGNNVTQGAPMSTIDKLIEEMRAQRESAEKQIDRLLTIIENMNTPK